MCISYHENETRFVAAVSEELRHQGRNDGFDGDLAEECDHRRAKYDYGVFL